MHVCKAKTIKIGSNMSCIHTVTKNNACHLSPIKTYALRCRTKARNTITVKRRTNLSRDEDVKNLANSLTREGPMRLSRDKNEHGVLVNTWVFILRRYNGTYTQARGH